MENRL